MGITTAFNDLVTDDGVLLHTDTFTNRKPKRVPVGRGREWEIEVESAGVVTSAVTATDVKELL